MSTDTTGSSTSLYDTLGGAEPLKLAVDRFYVAVTTDPQLAHYFEGKDVTRIKRHQVLLLSQVLGGPAEYDGRQLGEAHRGLHVTGPDYDRVVEHLIGTLRGLDVDDTVVSAPRAWSAASGATSSRTARPAATGRPGAKATRGPHARPVPREETWTRMDAARLQHSSPSSPRTATRCR